MRIVVSKSQIDIEAPDFIEVAKCFTVAKELATVMGWSLISHFSRHENIDTFQTKDAPLSESFPELMKEWGE